MAFRLQHRDVDREVATQVHGAPRLRPAPREPVENDLAARRRKVLLQQIEHRLRGACAVYGQNLSTMTSAEAQDVLENLLLKRQRSKKTRPAIQAHLADVAGFVQVGSPKLDFARALGYQLRMEAESRTHVLGSGNHVSISRPGLGRRRDR